MIQTTAFPGIIVNLSSFLEPLGQENYNAWVEELGQDLTWGDAAYTLVNLESVFSVDRTGQEVLTKVTRELREAHPLTTIYLNHEG